MDLHNYEIEKVLEKNMTTKGFSFWKALNERLPNIWQKPTSSTGKYHKKADGTVPDCAEHVYQMLYAASKVSRMFNIAPKTPKMDMLMLSVVLHDTMKYGKDGKRTHTDNKHDQLAGNMIRDNKETFRKLLTESDVGILEDSVRFHSGQWSSDVKSKKDFSFNDRDPIAMFVHVLDMMSTADVIKTPVDDIPF